MKKEVWKVLVLLYIKFHHKPALVYIYRYERMSYLTSYRETVPRHVALGSPGCVGDWTR